MLLAENLAGRGPRRCFTTTTQSAASSAALPAHLSYDIKKLKDMSTVLLVARSAVASAYDDESFWRSCSLTAQRLVHEASLSDLANFTEAVAQSSFRDDELMYNVGDTIITKLEDLDTDALAAMLRAHSRLSFRNDRVISRLQDTLYEHMQKSRATAPGLSSSLLSLAQLTSVGCIDVPPKELLEAAARMVSEHLAFFSVPQLSEVLQAHATFGLRGDRQTSALLAGIGGVFVREAHQLTSEHCSAAVRSFAKCRVHDERLLSAVASRLRDKSVRSSLSPSQVADTLYGFAKFTCQDTALLDLLSIEARRSLHLMEVPIMSIVLSSLAKAGVSSWVLTSRAAVMLKRSTPEHIDTATTQELSALTMAFGKLQARDGALFDACAESYLRRETPPFTQVTCSELVNIVHAFTKVHHLHPKLFGVIGHALLDRFDDLSLQDIVKYLHGIAKVEYLPLPPLQERIVQTLQLDQVSTLGVFDLLKLATASRRLGLRIPSLESHVSAVLPNEADSPGDTMGPGRRVTKMGPKKRRQSSRKRKWTW